MDHRPMETGEINRNIRSVAAGDQNAFAVLYTGLRKPVYGLALNILRDRGLAEDVIQNTFLKVSQQASRFERDVNGKAWILRIARNEALDMLRKRRDLPEADPEADTGGGTRGYAEDDADIERATDSLVLRQAMRVLSRDENQVVYLHLYCDLRHKDVARLMDIPPGTAGRIYSDAIRKLKAGAAAGLL